MKEEWRDIEGYEGLYKVSNLGRVKSLGKYLNGKGNSIYWKDEQILKPILKETGYLFVNLWKNRKMKQHYVHRLVAEAFIQNPHNLPQVNHKDECKTNNFISLTNHDDSNLEWCTQAYNNNYGTRTERTSKPVICIDTNIRYESVTAAAMASGLHKAAISGCCIGGRNKTAGGYHWKYAN